MPLSYGSYGVSPTLLPRTVFVVMVTSTVVNGNSLNDACVSLISTIRAVPRGGELAQSAHIFEQKRFNGETV